VAGNQAVDTAASTGIKKHPNKIFRDIQPPQDIFNPPSGLRFYITYNGRAIDKSTPRSTEKACSAEMVNRARLRGTQGLMHRINNQKRSDGKTYKSPGKQHKCTTTTHRGATTAARAATTNKEKVRTTDRTEQKGKPNKNPNTYTTTNTHDKSREANSPVSKLCWIEWPPDRVVPMVRPSRATSL